MYETDLICRVIPEQLVNLVKLVYLVSLVIGEIAVILVMMDNLVKV